MHLCGPSNAARRVGLGAVALLVLVGAAHAAAFALDTYESARNDSVGHEMVAVTCAATTLTGNTAAAFRLFGDFGDAIFGDGFEGCGGSPAPTQSCYTGPTGTAGVGVCSLGTRTCINNSFGPCTGEIRPSAESCNGLDDDCSGAIDNDLGNITCGVGACQRTVAACAAGSPGMCMPGPATMETCNGVDDDCDGAIDELGCGCVHVSLTGIDTNSGSPTSPKRTISAAIGVAGTMGLSNRVCVAGPPNCAAGSGAPAVYAEAVTMRNGVHVYGGYSPVGANWPRNANCVTRIDAQDPRGVYFGPTVTAPSILDGFVIQARSDATNAAVTVQGSTGAFISSNIVNGAGGTTSHGINVIDSAGTAATPTLTNNAITGGTGSALAIGVRSLNSAPAIRGNCSGFDFAGRCNVQCFGVTRFIRGRPTGSMGVESYGVLLEDSPGTVVDRNSICSSLTLNSTTNAAGLRFSGDATGTVIRANNIVGSGGQQNAVGVWADPCAGASPWLVNNALIAGNSTTAGARADGIRALGSCHVRIDHNVQIIGGAESANADTNGVFCAKDAGSGVASRCTILDNGSILGSGAGFPPTSTGIRCDDGACARIENNGLISGRGGVIAVGVSLTKTGTFVDANVIRAGCAGIEGVGLLSNDSFARIQNNQISGADGTCSPPPAPLPASTALKAVLSAGANEIDLHSNDLFAEGFAGACTSRGIAFDSAGSPPAGPRGIVRNNIVLGGNCNTRYDVDEMNTVADPRVLQNNDLWQNTPFPFTVLYRNENSADISDISTVNALADITASGNISADPLYTTGHLSASSACRNAGIATGAPTFDFEGDSRPQETLFDIGRDEFLP